MSYKVEIDLPDFPRCKRPANAHAQNNQTYDYVAGGKGSIAARHLDHNKQMLTMTRAGALSLGVFRRTKEGVLRGGGLGRLGQLGVLARVLLGVLLGVLARVGHSLGRPSLRLRRGLLSWIHVLWRLWLHAVGKLLHLS